MPAHERSGIDLLTPEARALVDELLATPGQGRAVAFDADGTLWRGDIGEELLRHLAAEDHLPRHRGRRGLYAEYERRVSIDPADAYAFAVEVMEDLPEDALAELCAGFFRRRFEGRVFPYARRLLTALEQAGYALWIVSASPLWPVVAGAVALGVPARNVIGVDCVRSGGRLTRDVLRPVPCGEGKVAWLEKHGVKPVLAVGNGDLDLPMLAWAERALVVAPPGEDNDLVREARGRGWPIQRC
jgi:phosphatidylglycerophosphatase C